MIFDRTTANLVELLYLNTPDDSEEELDHLLDRLQPLTNIEGLPGSRDNRYDRTNEVDHRCSVRIVCGCAVL
jgi:hypothetical protein